jgi:hypothetical protein
MAKSDEFGSIMSRNNPVASSLRGEDVYKQWLISKGGSTTGGRSLRQIEMSFFAANGGTGKTYSELMGTFLGAKGFNGGSLKDRWRRFLAGGTV